jgi:outer membrane protein with beta-barrel domain
MVQTSSRTGFYAGGYLNLSLGDIISIEPGLYYSQKGYTMKGDFNIKAMDFIGANAGAQLQLSYIDAPLVMKANLAKGLQVFAGPQISYLAHSNLQVNAGALGLSLFRKNMDVTDNFNKWDVALTGGLTYQFANGINIQAAYDYGLSKVDANKTFKSYNNVVKVGVGFTF